jgi:DNA repair protein RadA/Sms
VNLSVGACDVYVKVAGGIRIDEPAIDLALSVALASSFRNCKVLPKTIIFGEVGLAGEVRTVSQAEVRIAEAVKMGFKHVILPKKNLEHLPAGLGIQLHGVDNVRDALRIALQG